MIPHEVAEAGIINLNYIEWRPSGVNAGLGRYVFYAPVDDHSELAALDCDRYGGHYIGNRRLLDDEADDDVPLTFGDEVIEDKREFARENDVCVEEESLSPEDLALISWEKTRGEGRWLTIVDCPRELFGLLVGKKGAKKAELERRFPGASVSFEEGGFGGAQMKQKGRQRRDVRLAVLKSSAVEIRHESSRSVLLQVRRTVESEIARLWHRLPYTHFISLPFLSGDNDELMNRYQNFRRSVLLQSDLKVDKIDSSLFQLEGQLHFTLCMLKLYKQEDLQKVLKILQSLSNEPRLREFFHSDKNLFTCVASPPPPGFYIKLKGVKVMEDDLKETHVLFTLEEDLQDQKVTLEQQTQKLKSSDNYRNLNEWLSLRRSAKSYFTTLCEVLYQKLADVKLLDETEMNKQRLLNSKGEIDVKFHITLMNSKYRSFSNNQQPTLNAHETIQQDDLVRTPFDATQILQKFKNYDFGIGVIKGIHLSQRGKPAADTSYYHAECVVPICPKTGL